MNTSIRFLMILLSVWGCSTSGSRPPPGPLSWPQGRYELNATVQYRPVTGGTVTTAEYHAELEIGAEGYLHLQSSSGICQDPTPDLQLRDQTRGQRTFLCNDAVYVIKPMAETVRGTIHVTVIEAVQRQGECREWGTVDNQRVCLVYSSEIYPSEARKTTRLIVRKRSPLPPEMGAARSRDPSPRTPSLSGHREPSSLVDG